MSGLQDFGRTGNTLSSQSLTTVTTEHHAPQTYSRSHHATAVATIFRLTEVCKSAPTLTSSHSRAISQCSQPPGLKPPSLSQEAQPIFEATLKQNGLGLSLPFQEPGYGAAASLAAQVEDQGTKTHAPRGTGRSVSGSLDSQSWKASLSPPHFTDGKTGVQKKCLQSDTRVNDSGCLARDIYKD